MADEVQQVSTQPESQVAEPLSQEGETSGQIPLTRKPLKMKGKAAKATPLSPKASGSSKSGPGQRKRSAKLKLQP